MADEITLESIFAKDVGDLTEEEVTHLNEHKSQLTPDQLEKFGSVLTDDETNPPKDDDSDEDGKNDTSA